MTDIVSTPRDGSVYAQPMCRYAMLKVGVLVLLIGSTGNYTYPYLPESSKSLVLSLLLSAAYMTGMAMALVGLVQLVAEAIGRWRRQQYRMLTHC